MIASLLLGSIYQRADNTVAPWLAHTIGGIGLVLVGETSFIRYMS